MKSSRFSRLAAALVFTTLGAAASAQTTVVDFSSGTQGWTTHVNSWIDDTVGNAAPAYRTQMIDTFGLTWSNTDNPAFLGAFQPHRSVTIALDIQALSITYLGDEVSRDLVVELRDYDNKPADLPYTSVWFNLGTVSADAGLQHLSVTIADTSATALPAGWGGYGAETALGEPVLPANRTFGDVLAGVDEFVFTTYVPGYFYGFTNYDVVVDNISISAVPEPSMLALNVAGLVLLAGLARRRRR